MRKRNPNFVLGLAFILWMLPASLPAQEEGESEYSRSGADTCLACHGRDQEVLAIFYTKHGQRNDPRTPFGDGGLQCEACHGPGGDHTGRVKRGDPRPTMPYWGHASTASNAEHNQQCLGCHESHVGLDWAGSAHNFEDLNCADCHNPHSRRDPVLQAQTQSEVCFDCHKTQQADASKPSSHPIRFGRIACTDCHQPHGSTTEAMLVGNSLNDTCYGCHQEKRGPLLWEHAPVTEDCSICHQPHGSVHQALLVKRPPLLCQQCHSQAGHPSVAYTPDGLPSGAPNQNLVSGSCLNCHSQVHGSNHPSGAAFFR